jgi:hypothetical protein
MAGMEKEDIIALIQQIQNGGWNRHVPTCPKSEMAERHWNESLFSYGMEYGAIVVLMQVFSISASEL